MCFYIYTSIALYIYLSISLHLFISTSHHLYFSVSLHLYSSVSISLFSFSFYIFFYILLGYFIFSSFSSIFLLYLLLLFLSSTTNVSSGACVYHAHTFAEHLLFTPHAGERTDTNVSSTAYSCRRIHLYCTNRVDPPTYVSIMFFFSTWTKNGYEKALGTQQWEAQRHHQKCAQKRAKRPLVQAFGGLCP